MRVPPPARSHRGETCTSSISHPTRLPSPATASAPRQRGRTCVCRHRRVTIAARPARHAHLARRVHPPGHGRQRSSAGPHMPPAALTEGHTARTHLVPLRARHVRARTGTSSAVRALQSPSPAALASPQGSTTCLWRVAIAARQARTVQLTRRNRPPPHTQPWPGEGLPGVAHTCAATDASRLQREKHAPCCSRDATALPSHGRWRARAGQHMRVPPPARRGRSETSTHCAARATRLPSSATASRGPTPCSTLVCRHRRVMIVAR